MGDYTSMVLIPKKLIYPYVVDNQAHKDKDVTVNITDEYFKLIFPVKLLENPADDSIFMWVSNIVQVDNYTGNRFVVITIDMLHACDIFSLIVPDIYGDISIINFNIKEE